MKEPLQIGSGGGVAVPPEKRVLISLLVLACLIGAGRVAAAEWNGGSDWALFDVAERRAMWVWNMGTDGAGTRSWDTRQGFLRGLEDYKGSRDLCLDFCENKSIRSIYVFNATWEWDGTAIEAGEIPNEAAWVDLVADAQSRGIQVWLMGYLWDDPDDARMANPDDKEAIKKIMQAIYAFNQAHPTTPIAGFHDDQEPSNAAMYDDLLDTMKIAQDWVNTNAPGLQISQALRPIWRDVTLTWSGKTQTMNEHIQDTIGHCAYMAYSDNPDTVLNTYATPACNRAAAIGHKLAVGLEVGNIAGMYSGAEGDTWYEEIQAEPTATRFKTDPGAPVTFEDCLHDTASALHTNAGYDRIVIHSYSSYFNHWFGQYPRDFILAQPGGTYDSAAANPPAVDVLDDMQPLAGLGPRRTAGGHNDSDGDTCADLLEIALGSDPHDTNSRPVVVIGMRRVESPEGGLALGWPGVADVQYRATYSPDLMGWSLFTAWQPGSNGWQELFISTSGMPPGDIGFFRVEISLP